MTRRSPVVRFPLHLEAQYARRLLRRLAVLRRLAEAALARRADNDADAMRARMALEAARRAAEAALPTDFGSLAPTARAVDAFATRQTTRALGVLGVDVEADRRIGDRSQREMHRLHVGWARENVALIQGLDRRTWTDLAEHVAEAVREGRTDLAGVLEDRFGVAGSRARLIARDQIGSLNARITEARQRQLGIQAYEWSSSGDERVRPLHRRLDGQVRRWDEPHVTEGHPGEAIQCRCVAIPVIDDVPAPAPVLPRPLPALPATFGGPLQAAPGGGAPPPPPPPSGPLPRRPLDLGQTTRHLFEDLTEAERAADMVKIFHRDVKPEEIVSWAGVDQSDLGPDTTVELVSTGGSVELHVTVHVPGERRPVIKLHREYRRYLSSNVLVAEHHSADAPGHGLRLFGRSVALLRTAGFARITTLAARSARYNGYYTWPRFGYDAPLAPRYQRILPDGWEAWFAPPAPSDLTMLQLMSTQEGRNWWRLNGGSLAMAFDLAPGSSSRTALQRYQRERGVREDTMARHTSTDEAWRQDLAEFEARALERFERTGQAEDVVLTPEDEAALDRAWQSAEPPR